jgi:UDP-N-acetylglucosamine 1-carboxyvinyltransferase
VASRKRPNAVDVITLPFPGFPTDLQAQMMAMLSLSRGISVITEKIYPERFMHISELNRMGARISLEGATAVIKGVSNLSGAPVMASDLRASAALVLAALVAEGESVIDRVYHIDRGYEHIEQKLSNAGARIRRLSR